MILSFFVDKFCLFLYNKNMDFKLKNIENVLSVPKIANVHFFEFPKQYETKDDKHPFCELIFVNVGSLCIRSDEYSGKLSKNEMLIHGANCVHSLICPKESETSVIIIGFECHSERLQAFAQKPLLLSESEIRQLAEIVKEGRNVFAPPYNVPVYDMEKKKKQVFGSEQMLQSLLENFLIGLIRKHEVFESESETEDGSFQIGEILKYVDANYLERITIDELAFLFRTNRSTLCQEFKNATGGTLVRYISDKKTQAVKRLLLHSKKSVAQIADELNFDCVPYFCKFFKKQTSMTPKDFRKNTLLDNAPKIPE